MEGDGLSPTKWSSPGSCVLPMLRGSLRPCVPRVQTESVGLSESQVPT